MSEVGQAVVGILFIVLFICAYFGPAAWAVGDAQKRGQSGGAIVLLFWLLGLLSAFIWLAIRPSEQLRRRTPDSFDDPDDALAAASRLATLGDWEQSIALYVSIRDRWPDHTDYVNACLDEINERRALA
ncbi:hypothetical protein Mal15_31280 [Stieleria maiorica]|uniref:Tetratricopeptide repeat protein n=1 Tax=Stieleria maiorica TaxID=2795974 RepID=A0A5B9MEX5_9BACT|nr:hypothetical protein [Stieleria maiorica]QEF99069.1 hypothetical protein Mal15_31280 [Stieleria maiorica]